MSLFPFLKVIVPPCSSVFKEQCTVFFYILHTLILAIYRVSLCQKVSSLRFLAKMLIHCKPCICHLIAVACVTSCSKEVRIMLEQFGTSVCDLFPVFVYC